MFAVSAKDDPQLVRDHLARVRDLMVARQQTIRAVLGVKNMWHVGPSQTWPLVVVVIDEAHTFLNETKGTDAESKRLDALARETARLVEELIRKGRNVGIQVILATQKATGYAIPTKIRDNCQVAVSFAHAPPKRRRRCSAPTSRHALDEHPRRLQDPAYVGVASMVAQGRPGFTLVRTPYVPDEVADRIADARRRTWSATRAPADRPRGGGRCRTAIEMFPEQRAAAHSAKNTPPRCPGPVPTKACRRNHIR